VDELFSLGRLTVRERYVAVLAAYGLRGRDIAQQLGIPVRTVEGHIYRVYDKLHVRSRLALAAALSEPPPEFAAALGQAVAALTELTPEPVAAASGAAPEPTPEVSGAR
jgi:DNA-binding CsgD family transcriptional regulator